MVCKDENTPLSPCRPQSSRSASLTVVSSGLCRFLTWFVKPECDNLVINNSFLGKKITLKLAKTFRHHATGKILHCVYRTRKKSVHKKLKWTKASTALISSLQALQKTFFIVNFIIRLLSYSCHPPSGGTGTQEKTPQRLLRGKGICNESWGPSSLQMTLIAVQAEACWEMANTRAGYGSSTLATMQNCHISSFVFFMNTFASSLCKSCARQNMTFVGGNLEMSSPLEKSWVLCPFTLEKIRHKGNYFW